MPTNQIAKRGRTRINLAIEAGPHALLKVTAAALGKSLDQAYTEAARLWNATHVRPGQNGKAAIPLSQALSDEAFRDAEVVRLAQLAQKTQDETAPIKRAT